MSDLRKAAQQALQLMRQVNPLGQFVPVSIIEASKILKAALAQPEKLVVGGDDLPTLTKWTPMAEYAAPPQRKPLTEAQIAAIDWKDGETLHDFARAIEKAHGIGGEG